MREPGANTFLSGEWMMDYRDVPGECSKVVEGLEAFLRIVGRGECPGTKETPDRWLKAMTEMVGGYQEDPRDHLAVQFDLGQRDTSTVIVLQDVEFVSLCEHHLLPFFGRATIAYEPDGEKVVGLSKLARVLDGYARRLQVQERLGHEVALALWEVLRPRGVLVRLEARHMCLCARGVKKPGASMVTVTRLGEQVDLSLL